jgi:type IX secretion system PorP/SprF family membrane protein
MSALIPSNYSIQLAATKNKTVKKIILAILVLVICSDAQSQNRKHSSNFSIFQQYYNPAFTGFQGSMIKSYYRNQWAGFDGAPKTLFISGEVNLSDYKEGKGVDGEEKSPVVTAGIQHSLGLSVLYDSYGPFVENQIFLSYRSRINLTEKVSLQAGGAIAYHLQSLDGNKLTTEEANDPTISKYSNQSNRSGRVDFNLGLALTGQDFYAGYAMQNIVGSMSETDNDYFRNNSKIHYIVQGGYRKALSDKVGIIVNALLRFDKQLDETVEGQLKAVFYNTVWAGFGYRNNLAYSLNVGFRMKQLRVGYAYEIPTGDAQMTGSTTSEILLTYDLKKIVYPRLTRVMSIW